MAQEAYNPSVTTMTHLPFSLKKLAKENNIVLAEAFRLGIKMRLSEKGVKGYTGVDVSKVIEFFEDVE